MAFCTCFSILYNYRVYIIQLSSDYKVVPFTMKMWTYKRAGITWGGQLNSILLSQCIWLYKKCSLWWEGPYERALTVYRHIEQSIWHYKGTKKTINYKVPLLLAKYISCIIPHSFGYKIEYKYNNHNTIISVESIKVRMRPLCTNSSTNTFCSHTIASKLGLF